MTGGAPPDVHAVRTAGEGSIRTAGAGPETWNGLGGLSSGKLAEGADQLGMQY